MAISSKQLSEVQQDGSGDGDWVLPGVVNIQKAIQLLQMAIEIVDLPIKNGDFP